jgi:hypothetical protein
LVVHGSNAEPTHVRALFESTLWEVLLLHAIAALIAALIRSHARI